MTTDTAIRVQNLSKCYQIYDTPRDRLHGAWDAPYAWLAKYNSNSRNIILAINGIIIHNCKDAQ